MAESSDGFLDRAPSDEGLYKVLQKHPNWYSYAIPLGLSIEQKDFFFCMKQRDNGVLALRHWRDGHCGDHHPGTWRFLLKVIGGSIGPNRAGNLEKEVPTNSNWTLPDTVPPGDCHCFTGMKPSPPVSDGMAKFNECISNLKEIYLEDSVIQDDLLEMNPEVKYLPLSYVKVKKETDEKEKERPRDPEPVEYDDIISSVAGGPKRVLLQGGPGSGKSTTLRKICHDFAKSSLPPEIKVVVRVVLGELEEGTKPKMKDLMQTCISDSEDNSDLIEAITSFAREHNGKGILFLFDGFDELARDLQKKSLVADILSGKAYRKSSYIITSRPSATAQLPPQTVQQMDRVETQGFAEDRMKQFIQQWFQTRPDTGEKVIEIIMDNSKLSDMCRNPLTVLIACTIASEEQMLPDRMTILLKAFMCILGNSYLKKKGQEPSIVQWEDLEEQCSSFKELADLALHGFLKGQYTFTDRDSSLPHRPSKLEHMGLFRVTSQRKGGAIVKSYQFFHLIVQEFLSAYALSLKSSKDQTAFWGEHLMKGPIIKTGDLWKDRNLSLYVDRRFETIFQFYAGLTSLRDGNIQQLLFNTVDTNESLVLSYNYPVTSEHSAVVYESQNEEVANQILSRYNPYLIILDCKQPQQWMWCLQHASFSSLFIGRMSWVVLPQELVKQVFDTNKDRLEEVHWAGLFEEDVGFAVEMTAECTKLKILELAAELGRIAFLSFQSFLNVLNKSTSLETLSLKRVQLSDMDVEPVVGDISGAIQQLKNLSDVRLEKCCDELTRGVVKGLWRKQTPQHQVPSSPECGLWDLVWDTLFESDGSLSLSVDTRHGWIGFKEQSLRVGGEISQKSLVKFLNKSTSLQTLSLKRVQLSHMDVEPVVGDISGAIQQLKNLSDVTLEGCSDELTRGVVDGVVDSQCIQKFTFTTYSSERKYSEEVLKSLQNIKNSRNLRDFSLTLKQLPYHCTASIVCGCFQSKTLETLRILVKEVTADGVDGELMTRLESAIKNSKNLRDFTLDLGQLPFHYMASIVCECFQSGTLEELLINVGEVTADGIDGELMTRLEYAVRDNNTLREFKLNPYEDSPVPASVAEAMLKGAAHNKRLEEMAMTVPDTAELHKLVDEVKEVNKKLRLDVEYNTMGYPFDFSCDGSDDNSDDPDDDPYDDPDDDSDDVSYDDCDNDPDDDSDDDCDNDPDDDSDDDSDDNHPEPPPPKPPQSHQQGDSGPLLPSQKIAPPSTPLKEPDELENDGEKGVSSVITSQLEEGENEETQSSPVISSQIEEEGENKGAHNSSENLSRPEEKEKVLERYVGKLNVIEEVQSNFWTRTLKTLVSLFHDMSHEAVLSRNCWIPFGYHSITVDRRGDTYDLCSDSLTKLTVPRNAVRGETAEIRYAIIGKGPFQLPPNYQLGSFVVYVHYNPEEITTPVTLSLPTWYGGDVVPGEPPPDGLSFAVAPHTLGLWDTQYYFQLVNGGDFSSPTISGALSIKGHSSLFAVVFEEGATSSYFATKLEYKPSSDVWVDTFTVCVVLSYASVLWTEIIEIYWGSPNVSVEHLATFQFKENGQLEANIPKDSASVVALNGPRQMTKDGITFEYHNIRSALTLEKAVMRKIYPPKMTFNIRSLRPEESPSPVASKQVYFGITGADVEICSSKNVFISQPVNPDPSSPSPPPPSLYNKKPSDAALNGILRICPDWTSWIVDLGVPIDVAVKFQSKPMGDLLALQYWRDGKSGELFPSTWKFLLNTVEVGKGREVAQKILKKVEQNESSWCVS